MADPVLDKEDAKNALEDVFSTLSASLKSIPVQLRNPTKGKVYEVVVLAQVLRELRKRGFGLSFSNPGGALHFKGAPGKLNQSEPHFDVHIGSVKSASFQVFLSAEFTTLGSQTFNHGGADLSERHEIDIGVYQAGQSGYPPWNSVALAVECKAEAKVTKAMVRGVLGLRRELSYLTTDVPTILASAQGASSPVVPADPPSEVWLASTDHKVTKYSASPKHFGVECKYFQFS